MSYFAAIAIFADAPLIAVSAARQRVGVFVAAALVAVAAVLVGLARSERARGNTRIASFHDAKRAMKDVFADHRRTLYCDCQYDGRGEIDFTSCGYVPTKASKRRVEWEHVVPAEAFGRSFREWREGHSECIDKKGKPFHGRNCARKTSSEFRRMEADMYNLYPEAAELNRLRANYAMAMIAGEARAFGGCDVEIADHEIEPRPEIRGDIARTYAYMDAAYPGRGVLSDKNRKLFEAWSHEDPVDAWECERAARIASMQGNTNEFVMAACAQVARR